MVEAAKARIIAMVKCMLDGGVVSGMLGLVLGLGC
jgi:hypothetical protein